MSRYPACAIDEYASIRLRLLCVSAATLPTVIVTIASTSNSSTQSALSVGSPSRKIRSSIANDAAFDPTDRNAVTGVGAPSYTSGAHMWNGTAAILNPMPAATSDHGEDQARVVLLADERRRHHAQAGRARQAVHERHAVQQDAERKRAEQEILHRRLVRSLVGLDEPGQDVERHGHRLEADEDRDEVDAAGHDHHAERGAQDEEVVLPGLTPSISIYRIDISTVSAAASRNSTLKNSPKPSTAISPCATSTCVPANGTSDAAVAPSASSVTPGEDAAAFARHQHVGDEQDAAPPP